jgi:hypothetical protein
MENGINDQEMNPGVVHCCQEVWLEGIGAQKVNDRERQQLRKKRTTTWTNDVEKINVVSNQKNKNVCGKRTSSRKYAYHATL